MKIRLALFAVFATACTGDLGTKDTGTTETGTTACEGGFYDGPVTIQRVSVDCNGRQVTFLAETEGWTNGGWVFSQETRNPEPQWADEHDLESVDWDECGAWDNLERTLSDADTLDDPLNDWQRNRSTVFQCDQHYESTVMSYAFAVTDREGNFAHCVVFGDDPNGLSNGNYDAASGTSRPSFDLGDCVRGVETF